MGCWLLIGLSCQCRLPRRQTTRWDALSCSERGWITLLLIGYSSRGSWVHLDGFPFISAFKVTPSSKTTFADLVNEGQSPPKQLMMHYGMETDRPFSLNWCYCGPFLLARFYINSALAYDRGHGGLLERHYCIDWFLFTNSRWTNSIPLSESPVAHDFSTDKRNCKGQRHVVPVKWSIRFSVPPDSPDPPLLMKHHA